MNHDARLAGVSQADLRLRRMGGLAAIFLLAALIVSLALASPDAKAPELAIAAPAAMLSLPTQADAPAASFDGRVLPMDCSLVAAEPVDCIYN